VCSQIELLVFFRHKQTAIRACFMLVSCLAYSSTLKVESTFSSETLVEFQQITRHYIPTFLPRRPVRAACGICGGQSGAGAGFFRALRFPLPIIIPPMFPPSELPGAGTIGLLVAAVPSGPNWTHPPAIPTKNTCPKRQNSSHAPL
jgi:hypothetical protein